MKVKIIVWNTKKGIVDIEKEFEYEVRDCVVYSYTGHLDISLTKKKIRNPKKGL